MHCFYCSKEDKTAWHEGDSQGFFPVGYNITVIILPKDGTKVVAVDSTLVEFGTEHPAKRIEKAEAARLKAEAEAQAKIDAENAKAAAKARIKAEALAKAEAEADAKAEAEAAKEVAKAHPVKVGA